MSDTLLQVQTGTGKWEYIIGWEKGFGICTSSYQDRACPGNQLARIQECYPPGNFREVPAEEVNLIRGRFTPIVNGVRWRGAVGLYAKLGQDVYVECKIICPAGVRELSGLPGNPVLSPAAAVRHVGNQYLISTSYRVIPGALS